MGSAVEFIKEHITRETIRSILQQTGATNIKEYSNEIRCTCPIHKGSNPTGFAWKIDSGLWICNTDTCGGGDIFNFISALYDMDIDSDFYEVVKKTASFLGLDIENMEIKELDNKYRKEVMEFLKHALKKNAKFNEEYDIRKLGKMYALNEYRGHNREFLMENRIYYSQNMNRIVCVILDQNNKVIGASCRTLGNDTPKWIHYPKSIRTGSIFYNFNRASKYKEVILVEGIFDALKLISIGMENVLCCYGARLTDEQAMILLYNFDGVITMYDNDTAGEKATLSAIKKLHKLINVKVTKYEGHDPDEADLSTISLISWYDYIDEVQNRGE